MNLAPAERPTSIASVPQHLRPIVQTHIEIAEAFEKREIETEAKRIANIAGKEERRAMLARVRPVIRDRVRERAVVIFDQLKQEAQHDG